MDPAIKTVLNVIPADCKSRSVISGLAFLLIAESVFFCSLFGVFWLPHWLSFLSILGNGVSIAMLFIVGHDACHGSLTPNRRLNRWMGSLAFLPAMHPFSTWARTHNGMHHVWTNLKGLDPGYAPLSFDEYCKLSRRRQFLERCYRTIFGLGLFYFVEVWWKFEFFPSKDDQPINKREYQIDRLMVIAFLAAELLAFSCIAIFLDKPYPVLFSLYVVLVPYSVFLWLMGFVTFQHHTHPEIPWFDNKDDWSFFQSQVAGTTHVRFPRFIERILLNILEHSAHHVDPLIPLYHLHKGQRALETAFPKSIKIITWTPRVFYRTMRCCKLYDYRENRWLDFRGHPTTPRICPMRIPNESAIPETASNAV
jgi:omega-6 fatty acid desaturase (delta-12 desaturase)